MSAGGTGISAGYNALDDADDEDLFAYNYGGEFPESIVDMTRAMLGGRPVNSTLGPVQQIKMLAAAAEYRAATPRKAGKGKPLPPAENEGEQEVESRKTAQKACRRLIVPKPKSEKPDAFIRRLDAHRNATEALIPPMSADETEIHFAKRMVAVKSNEHENSLILPKSPKETDAEFDERLNKAKDVQVMIFPRGKHETNAHWKQRLSSALKSKRPILPKSADEPDRGFNDRCAMQKTCDRVVHPYDPEREDQKSYFRRLDANKQRTGEGFEPGDTKAINKVLGEPQKHVIEEHVEHPHHVDGAALMSAKMESLENIHHKEEESATAIQAKLNAEEAAAHEEEDQARKVEERLAEMKLKQEEERKRKEEEEMNKGFELEKIAINKIGFMPLKKLLMERGVPKEQVFACANKFALMEVAKKWGPELKVEWYDDSVVEVS